MFYSPVYEFQKGMAAWKAAILKQKGDKMKNYSGKLARQEKGKSQAKHGDIKTIEAQIAHDLYLDPSGMFSYLYNKGKKIHKRAKK